MADNKEKLASSIESVDSGAEVERVKKLTVEIREKPKKEDKMKALEEVFKLYFERNYMLVKKDGKFQLQAPDVAGEAGRKAKGLEDMVNRSLRDAQAPDVTIEKKDGADAFTMHDVFMEVFNNTLTKNSLVSDSLAKIPVDKIPDNFDKAALEKMLASEDNPLKGTDLEKFIKDSKNLTGAAGKERDKAMEQIAKAIKDYKSSKTTNEFVTNVMGAAGEQGKEMLSDAYKNTTGLVNNLGDKGLLGLVDSVPKIGSLLGLIMASMIPMDGYLKRALQLWAGGTFAYQNFTMNGDPIKDWFQFVGGKMGDIGGMLGLDMTAEAAETPPAAPAEKAAATTLTPEQQKTRNEELKAINALRIPKDDPEAKLVLQQSLNAPVKSVLDEIDPIMVHGNVYDFDISVRDLANAKFLDASGKEALQKGSLKADTIASGYYDILDWIGSTWRPALTRQMGEAFTQKKSNAYLAWFMMKEKVFTYEAQGTVLDNTKKYISPKTNFSLAAYLMLDRRSGQADNSSEIAADLAKSREQVGLRITTLSNLKQSFVTAEEKLKTGGTPPEATTTAPAPAASETAPAALQEAQDAEPAAALESLKQNYYTEDDIATLAGSHRAKADGIIQARLQDLITKLQAGHVDAAAASIKGMEKDLGTANFFLALTGKKIETDKAVNTILVRLYESQQMKGYYAKIEEMRKSLNA